MSQFRSGFLSPLRPMAKEALLSPLTIVCSPTAIFLATATGVTSLLLCVIIDRFRINDACIEQISWVIRFQALFSRDAQLSNVRLKYTFFRPKIELDIIRFSTNFFNLKFVT